MPAMTTRISSTSSSAGNEAAGATEALVLEAQPTLGKRVSRPSIAKIESMEYESLNAPRSSSNKASKKKEPGAPSLGRGLGSTVPEKTQSQQQKPPLRPKIKLNTSSSSITGLPSTKLLSTSSSAPTGSDHQAGTRSDAPSDLNPLNSSHGSTSSSASGEEDGELDLSSLELDDTGDLLREGGGSVKRSSEKEPVAEQQQENGNEWTPDTSDESIELAKPWSPSFNASYFEVGPTTQPGLQPSTSSSSSLAVTTPSPSQSLASYSSSFLSPPPSTSTSTFISDLLEEEHAQRLEGESSTDDF
ncbi:hypothetical protein BDY24DRAFT_416563 [Mrakia frigida]|uniref:uncharacterized protein n=1 Tax=Mrakia frigida TaxID=29902 RepID=UPI003FCC1168